MPKNSKTPVIESAEAMIGEATTLTIPQAAAVAGLSEFYVRKAVREGKLTTVKVPVKEGGKTFRHEIVGASFRAWREAAGAHSRREDGRNKFVLYLSEDEKAQLAKLIEGQAFAETLQRANIKAAAVVTEEA